MKECYLCKKTACSELLNLGRQPVCHCFTADAETDKKYPLILGQCGACGLVQLMAPFPVEQLTPKYAWVKYREPEEHMGHLSDTVSSLGGIGPEARVLGLTAHDEALLNVMRTKGFRNTEMIDPVLDLTYSKATAGVELVQDRLTPLVAREIANRRGLFDVVIARRIVEHAYNLSEFLHTLCLLLRPNGYIIVEAPDSQHAFEQTDAGVIWEEHVLYFTPGTFQHSFAFNGLKIIHFENYPYLQENCLVAIVEPSNISPTFPKDSLLKSERDRALAFADRLIGLREKLQQYLSAYREKGHKVALLGAGHRSCMFINAMELGSFLEFIIDDDPNKQSLRMPGSHLQIRGSKTLIDYGIKLCLLGINPESEDKVIDKNRDFLESGGVFASISPDSKYALQIQEIQIC